MENKKVSVVVPVYNAEKYLDTCVQSILGQTYSNLELILINDGSSDRSGEICERYAYENNNVIYKHQSNAGVSAARNVGLETALGDYIVFVDSDDRIKSNMIMSLVEAIENNQADLCVCGYDVIIDSIIKPITLAAKFVSGKDEIAGYFADHFAEAVASSVCCKLYKRSIIQHKFDTQLSMGEDLFFNLEYVQQINSVVTISEALYVYDRTNENSLTHKYKEIYHEQNLILFNRWLDWFNKYETVNDIWVHYRIVNLYLKKLFTVCSDKKPVRKLDIVKTMFNNDIAISIQRSRNLFDGLHKIVLQLIVKKRYRLLLIVCNTYCRVKLLFR